MIVRDEEKVLRRCLESVRGLVDEIIIVDTGSVDRTKEIAKEYTDHVYDFEWISDFSAAKNAAIRRATSKWILVLDADEYVIEEGHAALRSYLESLNEQDPIGFLLPIYNFTGSISSGAFVQSNAVRLFNNLPQVCFDRPIHEQVVLLHEELPMKQYPFIIFHTGYTVEVQSEKKKTERNLKIFDKLRQKQGFSDYDYFTLANEYYALNDLKKALYYYKRASTKKSITQNYIPHCLVNMLSIQIELDHLKDALETIESGIARWPNYVDFYCFKGAVYEKMGLTDKAEAFYVKCLDIANTRAKANENYWLVASKYGSSFPLLRLINISFLNLQWDKKIYYQTKLVQLNPNDQANLYSLIMLLLQSESVDSIISVLEKIYPEQTKGQAFKLFTTSLLTGNQALCQYFYSKCNTLEVPLQPNHLLYYAVIRNDRRLFDQILLDPQVNKHQEQINKLLVLASIVWSHYNYSLLLISNSPEDAHETKMYREIFRVLSGHQGSEHVECDVGIIASLLMDLFNMGYYDAYDRVVNRFKNNFADLTNILANRFFERNQIQLAIDYYSLLLREDKLWGTGYEYLARLYLQDGEINEGLEFLTKAISESPQNPELYILFINACSDLSKYNEMFQEYKLRFPQYWSLGLIH